MLVTEECRFPDEQSDHILLEGVFGIEKTEIQGNPTHHPVDPHRIIPSESLQELHRVPYIHGLEFQRSGTTPVQGAFVSQHLMFHDTDR